MNLLRGGFYFAPWKPEPIRSRSTNSAAPKVTFRYWTVRRDFFQLAKRLSPVQVLLFFSCPPLIASAHRNMLSLKNLSSLRMKIQIFQKFPAFKTTIKKATRFNDFTLFRNFTNLLEIMIRKNVSTAEKIRIKYSWKNVGEDSPVKRNLDRGHQVSRWIPSAIGVATQVSMSQVSAGCREWLLKRGVAIVVGELPPPLLLIPRTAAQQYRCSSVFP